MQNPSAKNSQNFFWCNSTWFNPLHAQFDSGCIIASKLEFDPATVNFKEFNYSPNEDAMAAKGIITATVPIETNDGILNVVVGSTHLENIKGDDRNDAAWEHFQLEDAYGAITSQINGAIKRTDGQSNQYSAIVAGDWNTEQIKEQLDGLNSNQRAPALEFNKQPPEGRKQHLSHLETLAKRPGFQSHITWQEERMLSGDKEITSDTMITCSECPPQAANVAPMKCCCGNNSWTLNSWNPFGCCASWNPFASFGCCKRTVGNAEDFLRTKHRSGEDIKLTQADCVAEKIDHIFIPKKSLKKVSQQPAATTFKIVKRLDMTLSKGSREKAFENPLECVEYWNNHLKYEEAEAAIHEMLEITEQMNRTVISDHHPIYAEIEIQVESSA